MSSAEETPSEKPPVLHVVVIGFHHKKGCQVEYSYPPLITGGSLDSHDLPDEWRHLPSMALPDGAHNHLKDTIYFHLPSRENIHKTVYGVSCYRQMDAKDLVNKTADVTRSSVQKSVCVLSRLPLYGLIKAKLELITHAYFDERDFTKVELLTQTYTHLNSTLSDNSLINESRIFLGLSPRDLIHLFKHKIVLLLKLLLLERRVLFSGGPVEKLCSILLSVISLIPGMLEHGLEESSNYSLQNQLSPTLKLANFGIDMEDYLEISYKDLPNHKDRKRENSGESNTQTKLEPIQAISKTEEPTRGNNSLSGSNCDINTSETFNHDPLGVGIHVASENKLDKTPDNGDIKCHEVSSSLTENISLNSREKIVNSTPEDCDKSTIEASEDNKIVIDMINSTPDPLINIENKMHVQSVQNSSSEREPLFSDESPELSPNTESKQDAKHPLEPLDLGKVQNVTRTLSKKRDIITDIDSPESITEIDKEDGFHWEEDGLLLEIDQELGNSDNYVLSETENQLEDNAAGNVQSVHQSVNDLPSPPSSPEQPSSQTMERTDSTEESIMGLVETSDEDGTYRIVSKVKQSRQTAQTGNKNTNGAVQSSPRRSAKSIRNKLSNAFRRGSKEKIVPNGSNSVENPEPWSSNLQQDEFGFPLAIFTKGCLCHPYLCLQYYDLLQDVNVKSFLIGATNVLFKQKRHLTDIIIDVDDGKIDISDPGLRRQLQLTTADLRFADVLVKAVSEEENTYLEGTEWEGGDQWLRAQFRSYLLGLLTATQLNDEPLLEDYGTVYVNAWMLTNNHRVWMSTAHPALNTLQPGHPCHGNLSVNDIRVKFSSAMQGSERGRKINSAVTQTGKYVAQTGRAVDAICRLYKKTLCGALSQAKSSVTSWISNWKL